ncbi:MAG: transglycosylase SLT domain-containing protein [Erysipelotrichaceae bacterium]|nr:transglycosylase SLT domain-containing protein [Erysipelotrichaceae bacterium]
MKYLCIITTSLIIILHPFKGFAPDYRYVKLNLPKIEKIEQCSYYLSEKYIKTLAYHESRNVVDTVNKLGYIGLFQFGQSAINHLKLGFTVDEFKKNPKIFPRHKQISSLKKYTNYNKRILRNYIAKYKNTYFNGVYITEHGILAAAHLSGAGGVKRFFNEGYVAKDKNGTTIIKYLELFKNV